MILERSKDEPMADSPVDLFFDDKIPNELWSESIRNIESLPEQIATRKKLILQLATIQSAIPRADISFEEALDSGVITEPQIADFYSSLSELLASRLEYKRILLYLPFEYLISTTAHIKSPQLQEQFEIFRDAYLEAWKSMLEVQDARANFVNGDVLEVEKRSTDLPRVVKAAHLIPALVEKKWIAVESLIEAIENEEDLILQSSYIEAFEALLKLDLISDDLKEKIKKSTDSPLQKSLRKEEEENKEDLNRPEKMPPNLSQLKPLLEKKLSTPEGTDPSDTPRRRQWLIETHNEKVINQFAREASQSISNGTITNQSLLVILQSDETIELKLMCLNGLREAIENEATQDIEKAKSRFEQTQEELKKLWNSSNVDMKNCLQKLFFRLNHLGVIHQSFLNGLNLVRPFLGGPFSSNAEVAATHSPSIDTFIRLTKENPEFASCFYPVVMMGGSRVKGYGLQNSDIDLGIFIRSNLSQDVREKVRSLLDSIFDEDNGEDVTEFWLEKNEEEELKVVNLNLLGHVANSEWVHFLFGSVWRGEKEAAKSLFTDLLSPYLKDHKTEIPDFDMNRYLEILERDTLQYRLMHKGYDRYNAACGGQSLRAIEAIDGESVFWDSGYRAIATKLFVEKIFLPQEINH